MDNGHEEKRKKQETMKGNILELINSNENQTHHHNHKSSLLP